MVMPDFDGLKKSKDAAFGTRTWSPQKGENHVRIFAATSEQVDKKYGGGHQPPDHISLDFRSHFVKVQGEISVFRCLRDMNQNCPACTFHFQYRDASDKAVAETAKEFNNSLRYLMNMMDLNNPDRGVQPWECGSTVRNQILDLVAGGRWGDCLSPEEGRGFLVTQLGKTPWYATEPDADTSSVLEHLPEGWVEQLDQLEGCLPDEWDAERVQALVDQTKVLLGLLDEGDVTTPSAPAPKKASGGGGFKDKAAGSKKETAKDKDTAPAAAPPPAEEVVEDEPEAEEEAPEQEEASDADACEHGEDPEDCVDCRLATMGLD